MKHWLTMISVLLLSLAQAQTLEQGKVSVITCSPGSELYSVFGHSAFRVQGVLEGEQIDWVYNYGTFEFDDGFYLKFSRGKLDYMLSRETFPYFQYAYIQEGRGMVEQVLNLSQDEVMEVFKYLEWNYLPENRYYGYDFFFDNCSTRIVRVLQESLGDAFKLGNALTSEKTFRDMIHAYLGDMPWSRFGIDLALGYPCDHQLEYGEEQFLPDFLHDQLSRSTINGTPLVSQELDLLPVEVQNSHDPLTTPLVITSLLGGLLLLLLIVIRKNKKALRRFTRVYFVFTGFIGIMLLLLWFATDHTATAQNMNLLWAHPIAIVPAFFAVGQRKRWWLVIGAIFLLVMLFFPLLPQRMDPAVLPLASIGALLSLWSFRTASS